MKKAFTLFLLVAALLGTSSQSNAQVLNEGFDSASTMFSKPVGWTDSIFNFINAGTSYYPYGYPTWLTDISYSCSWPTTISIAACGSSYTRYGYYPWGTCSTPHPGPYGTMVGYGYNYYGPTVHTTQPGACYNSGMLTYGMYYNTLYQSYYQNLYSTPNPLTNVTAEIATAKMNLSSFFPSTGVGSFRLSYYIWNYNSTTTTNYNEGMVNVYVNNSPWSAGGVLIDSFQWANNTLSSVSSSWVLRQSFLPAQFNTSSSVYIIFKAHGDDQFPVANTSHYYNYYNPFMDDLRVDYIPPCGKPTAQPTNLTFSSSASIVQGSFTAASPAPTGGYIVLRSAGPLQGVPQDNYIYTVGNTITNGTVVSISNGTTFTDVSLTPGTNYTYTAFAISTGPTCSITYDTTLASSAVPYGNTGNITTGSTNIYTWNQSVSGNYQIPTNWTPSRIVPDPTDILVFDNGVSDTVTNVKGEGIGQMNIANNTQVHFRANASAITYTANINAVAGATGINIANGSGLIIDGATSALNLVFGNGSVPTIAGNLEVANTAVVNTINFSNAVTTISSTGQLAAGGSANTDPFSTATATNLIINGTFNHKYTTVGGFVPIATWSPGSTLLISGYTTATAGPASTGLAQTFANFVYNASNQTSAVNWAGAPMTVTGTTNVTSTGSGSWVLAGTQGYIYNLNNFVQAGGTVDLASGANATAAQVVNIKGTLNQLGGIIKSSGIGTTQPILYFSGTTGQQSVTLSNSPAGPIVYRVGNAAGINLIGINTMGSTPILYINSGGGVRISTTNANPINTSLLLQYATTNSTLTYDTSGNITATTAVWPTSTPPFNVVINVNTGNAVKVPFNATIPGTLTFLSGDIDMSTYNLTVGNNTLATNLGSIVEPIAGSAFINVLGNGNVRLTTGSLTRWFGTAGLPIAATFPNSSTGLTSQGYFPISYGASNRNVYIYFSSNNALGAGGTITVTHNPATGTSLLTPAVVDNTPPAYTMQVRTNASWSFTASSQLTLIAGASLAVKTTAGNLINPINVSQLRMTHLTTDPGANGGGGGGAPNFTATRNTLQITDLTGTPWYVSAASADIATGTNGVYTAITNGNWTTASAWDIGVVPTAANLCVINPGVTTTVNTATSAAKALTVLGTLNVNTAATTLNVDSQLINNGVVNVNGGTLLTNTNGTANATTLASFVGIYNYGNFTMNGGTVTMGPLNGGNKPFQNFGGLTVGTGTMTINGSFGSLPGSYFTQTGGNIVVDGNAGGNPLLSVPHGRAVFSLSTPLLNLWGGNVTIVDPHADTTYNNALALPYTFEYVTGVSALYNDSSAHTFTFGNGLSTDPAGSARGFFVSTASNAGVFNFSNMVVNGPGGTNREITPAASLGIQNSLIINNGGEYRMSGHDLVFNGNLTVNTGGKLSTDDASALTFGQLKFVGTNTSATVNPATPVVLPQTVSGTGIFTNLTTNTANLGNIKVLSSPYVVFNTGSNVIFPSTDMLTFTPVNNVPSRIIMATGNLAETGASASSNNASATNGWVMGGYQKYAAVGALAAANFTYPIGDSNNFTPVTLTTTGSVPNNILTAGNIAVSTKGGYSINLPFSTFNPAKVLNRTYTITTSPSLVYSPSSISIKFNWMPTDIAPGANYQNFKVGVNPSGTTWYYPHAGTGAATSITEDSLAVTGLAGTYQIGEACPPTVITQQPAAPGGCINAGSILMTVIATGANLQYQWYHIGTPGPLVNNGAIAGANSSSYSKLLPSYSDSGTYYVVITGACAAPDTSVKVKFIPGSAPPIVAQPLSSAVCFGYPTSISVTAINALTYRWQKNNVDIPSAPNSNVYNINSISVLDTGRYRVIVGNGCATADTSFVAYISLLPLPQATITTNTPLAFCQGGNVSLAGTIGTGYTYQWQNDGTNITGFTNSVYTAITPGRYTVAVTDVNHCTAISAPDSVTVFPSPTANASPLSPTTFCSGGSVGLVGSTSGTTYQWQIGGVNIPGPAATQPQYNATTSGNYSLFATDLNGCTGTSSAIQVTALTVPSGSLIASGPTSICDSSNGVTFTAPSGSNYTYQWYNGTALIQGATNSSYNANASGNYSAVISNGSCSYTTPAVSVTSYPLPANVISTTSPLTFCQGGSAVLSAGTGIGLTYQWQMSTDLGVTWSNVSTASSYTATANGQYRVIFTNAGNCSEITNPLTIQVNPLPSPTITAYDGVLSTASAASTTYQWYKNNQPVTGVTTSNTYTTSSNGVYTVYVTNNNGCSNMSPAFNFQGTGVSKVATQNIRIYPNPARDVVYIDAPFTVNASINSVDGKEIFSQPNAKSLNISGLANGIYMIRVSDADGNLISVEKLVKADN